MDNYPREELVLWDLACELDPRLVCRIDRTPGGCWLWKFPSPRGYGSVVRDGRTRQTHRYAYELLIGPIPEGLVIDHLCRRPPCLNPLHLEPVTQQVNVQRGKNVAERTTAPRPPGRNYKTFTCGTQAGFFAHQTRGEAPCDPCRLAHNADSAARMRKLRAARRNAA